MKLTSKKVSVQNAEHYYWGDKCDGWHLLKSDALSVIQERMPPDTSEQLHFHSKAQQLFYILSGEATFEIEDKVILVAANESLHIPQQTQHKISNQGKSDLHFIVISEPKSHGDRVNL
jgi:mannose-6-phosphate isomerase-like protein (cupin superfamily)